MDKTKTAKLLAARTFVYAVAGAAAAAGATAANADVVICTGANCVTTDENVLVDSASGNTAVGHTNNTNATVNYTSDSATDPNLLVNSSGQADVSSADGLLNSLSFALANGYTFQTALFNLFPLPGNKPNEATQITITYLDPSGHTKQMTINTNGQNFIGIYGTGGELFTGAGFYSGWGATPGTTGVQDMRQLRLGGVAGPVPEPATWALMILGFGGVGASMRAKRKKAPKMLQIA
jgi:hypothetical protein